MGKMRNTKQLKTAHLRHLQRTNQCDFRFTISLKDEVDGEICQDIRSVSQITATVGSLLKHTNNIIHKFLKEKGLHNMPEDFRMHFGKKSGHVQENMPCQKLFMMKGALKFYISNDTYLIVVNAPLIQSFTIPRALYAHSSITPQMRALFVNKELSRSSWSGSKDKICWTVLGTKFQYLPTINDIGNYIKICFEPYNEQGVAGETVEIVSEQVVETLPKLSLQCVNFRHGFTRTKLTGNEFRIISYNILSERYTKDNQFLYCDPKYLSLDYRRQLILHELLGYNADVICLQELDMSIYNDYFKEHLRHSGYLCAFFKKGNILQEGLGFMFDKSRFRRLDMKYVVLKTELGKPLYEDILKELKNNIDLRNDILRMHTSLLICALKCKFSNTILIIASTHLYYHSEADHIRLIQAIIANRCIEDYCRSLRMSEQGKMSVVFCGDFNSLPDSSAYCYLTRPEDVSTKYLAEIGCGRKILNNNFNLVSAYGTPPFTNYTDSFKGCLDYIFYEEGKLEMKQVVPLPAEDQMSEDIALPNKCFPSDHIALVADFKL